MSGTTCDPNDPRLGHGVDSEEIAQHEVYLIDCKTSEFVRPVRRTYIHEVCGAATKMSQDIAETYAKNPSFYGATYCVGCSKHLPVGVNGEFVWEDGSKVGS